MIRPKAVIPISLVVGLLIQTTAFASFPDVPASHENYDAINYAQSHEYVQGYADGTFRANQTINRAEFVKILVNANASALLIENIDSNAVMPFPDVRRENWFYQFVYSAFKNNMIAGYPDGTFKPGNTINFVEAAKIIATSDHIPQEPLEGTEWHPLTPGQGAEWFKPYVEYLAEKNVIPVSITSFDHKITRGEMAEIMYRLNVYVNKPSRTYDDLAHGTTSPQDTITVDLYFGDKKVIEESDCGATRSVSRQIPRTPAVADATLRLLLQGVTSEDKAQGLVSGFDNESGYYGKDIGSLLSYYQGINIVNGVATVQFSGDAMAYLNNTSCTQEKVKGSIAATLLQFSTIHSVQYSVDGTIVTEWDA